MTENAYRNQARRGDGAQEPDCEVCIHREECVMAQLGRFCPRFAREAPRDRGESPADAWARGEDSL